MREGGSRPGAKSCSHAAVLHRGQPGMCTPSAGLSSHRAPLVQESLMQALHTKDLYAHACMHPRPPSNGSGSGHEEAAQTVRSCCNVGYQSSWASNYSIHTAMRIPSYTSHPLPLLLPSPQLVAPAKWLWPLSGATQVRPVNIHFRNTSTRSLQQEQSTQLQLCLP